MQKNRCSNDDHSPAPHRRLRTATRHHSRLPARDPRQRGHPDHREPSSRPRLAPGLAGRLRARDHHRIGRGGRGVPAPPGGRCPPGSAMDASSSPTAVHTSCWSSMRAGNYLTAWGQKGAGPGDFGRSWMKGQLSSGLFWAEPWPGDSIAVCHDWWYAVSIFDSDGRYGRTLDLMPPNPPPMGPQCRDALPSGGLVATRHPSHTDECNTRRFPSKRGIPGARRRWHPARFAGRPSGCGVVRIRAGGISCISATRPSCARWFGPPGVNWRS